jgi:hypothetical protein
MEQGDGRQIAILSKVEVQYHPGMRRFGEIVASSTRLPQRKKKHIYNSISLEL